MEAVFGTIAGFTMLTIVLKKIVERLVKWFGISGDWITVTAILVGWGLAIVFTLDSAAAIAAAVGKVPIDLPQIVWYLVSGAAMAFVGGFMADREELKYGSVAGSQNVVLREEPFDPLTPEQRREAGLPPV